MRPAAQASGPLDVILHLVFRVYSGESAQLVFNLQMTDSQLVPAKTATAPAALNPEAIADRHASGVCWGIGDAISIGIHRLSFSSMTVNNNNEAFRVMVAIPLKERVQFKC